MCAGFGLVLLALAIAATAAWSDEPAYSRTKDIAYGDEARQMLDLYSPATVVDGTPVLMFFHGGGFTGGDKTQVINFGSSFAEAGVIVVSAGYRIDAPFPHFVEDAAKAVAYVHREFRTAADDPSGDEDMLDVFALELLY